MTSSITRGHIAFALLAVLASILCVRLGFWQLDRHAEKRNAAAAREARLSEPPVPLASLLPGAMTSDPETLAWRPVSLAGSWDYGGEVLIRSRGMDGRPGVHVVTPLRLSIEELGEEPVVVPVLRGWLPAPDAIEPASISTSDAGIEAAEGRIGVIRRSRDGAGLPVVLAGEGADRRPTLAAIDLEAIHTAASEAESLDRANSSWDSALAPLFFVQLLPAGGESRSGAARDPGSPVPVPVPDAGSGPHLAYAIQWFSFALIALVGTGAFLLQQRRSRRDPRNPSAASGPDRHVREGPTPG